jgi:NTE family protein
VGALRALLESGYRPDLLVGTSIGAVNAAFLAIRGVDPERLDGLVEAWHAAAAADLLPANYLWLALRSLFNRPIVDPYHRMRDFFLAHGLTEELCFADIPEVQLALVSTDLRNGCPVIFGQDPGQNVLEGLLASTALPPWVRPIEIDGRLLLDGGVVSTLPVEPAMRLGATEIIALDLIDRRSSPVEASRLGSLMGRLMYSVEQRTSDLECALAQARHIPLRRICLDWEEAVPAWDFSHTDELIVAGYAQTRAAIATWPAPRRAWWSRWR